MLKKDLEKRVWELETKLSNSQWKIHNLLTTVSWILYGKDNNKIWMYHKTEKIESVMELFYEIWKLVEFRNNILEERGYERQQNDNTAHIEFLKQRIEELEK